MSLEPRTSLVIAGASLFLATAIGALAAHGLERFVDADALANVRIGVEYHFYHALGLLGVGSYWARHPEAGSLQLCAWLLIIGMLLFSGSLYVLAAGPVPGLGMVTPLGGLCFLAAWLCFVYAAWSLDRPAGHG